MERLGRYVKDEGQGLKRQGALLVLEEEFRHFLEASISTE